MYFDDRTDYVHNEVTCDYNAGFQSAIAGIMSTVINHIQKLSKVVNVNRGVTMLDGARGKKQVWCPHIWTWGLTEANVLNRRKYTCNIVGTFRRSPQWFGPPIVIRRPGNSAPLAPLVTPLSVKQVLFKYLLSRVTRYSIWYCVTSHVTMEINK